MVLFCLEYFQTTPIELKYWKERFVQIGRYELRGKVCWNTLNYKRIHSRNVLDKKIKRNFLDTFATNVKDLFALQKLFWDKGTRNKYYDPFNKKCIVILPRMCKRSRAETYLKSSNVYSTEWNNVLKSQLTELRDDNSKINSKSPEYFDLVLNDKTNCYQMLSTPLKVLPRT